MEITDDADHHHRQDNVKKHTPADYNQVEEKSSSHKEDQEKPQKSLPPSPLYFVPWVHCRLPQLRRLAARGIARPCQATSGRVSISRKAPLRSAILSHFTFCRCPVFAAW